MTAADAKKELPDVPVKIGRRVVTARTTGRLNQFATVTIHGDWSNALGAAWEDRHYSWDAVARAATTGSPLTWD